MGFEPLRQPPGGLEAREADGLGVDVGVGDSLTDGLEGAELAPELLALGHVAGRDGERFLAHPGLGGADGGHQAIAGLGAPGHGQRDRGCGVLGGCSHDPGVDGCGGTA